MTLSNIEYNHVILTDSVHFSLHLLLRLHSSSHSKNCLERQIPFALEYRNMQDVRESRIEVCTRRDIRLYVRIIWKNVDKFRKWVPNVDRQTRVGVYVCLNQSGNYYDLFLSFVHFRHRFPAIVNVISTTVFYVQ